MSKEIVKAKLDVVFKKLFTSDNEVLKALKPTALIQAFRCWKTKGTSFLPINAP